jgi:hypothetical protein
MAIDTGTSSSHESPPPAQVHHHGGITGNPALPL